MGESHGIPPKTRDDLVDAVDDDTVSVYVYFGAGSEVGWRRARSVAGTLARVVAYRVGDRELIEGWIGNRRPKGLVFGFATEVQRFLNLAESEDRDTVRDAIQAANEATE